MTPSPGRRGPLDCVAGDFLSVLACGHHFILTGFRSGASLGHVLGDIWDRRPPWLCA